MASGTSTPSNLVPYVVFPVIVALAISAVVYFGLQQCHCDDQYFPSSSKEAKEAVAPH
ncbi:MAG: hypothetical protein NZ661_08075 [Candidatus Kapabacteria bacterium]|nr:hypothetical protein [Candidatus Kapabacteria bacterium]